MKIIVTHISPDWDAITSVWLIKKYLSGWQEAKVEFVPAGEKLAGSKLDVENASNPIEKIEENEVIHVDTGLLPLDHHQTSDQKVCAASKTWDFVRKSLDKAGDKL